MNYKVSPSQLQLVADCPASLKECHGVLSLAGDAAISGKEKHAAVARAIEDMNAGLPLGDLDPDVAFAVEYAKSLKERGYMLKPEFHVKHEGWHTESGSSLDFDGTIDLVARRVNDDLEEEVIIVDWKFTSNTGQDTADHLMQLNGYAFLLSSGVDKDLEEFDVVAVFPAQKRVGKYVQLHRVDVHRDVFKIIMMAASSIAMQPGREDYRPGEACSKCRAAAFCPARKTVLANAAALIPLVDGKLVTKDDIVAFYPKARDLEKALESYFDSVKVMIKGEGPIIATSGASIELSSSSRSRTLSADAILNKLDEMGFKSIADEIRDEQAKLPSIPQIKLKYNKGSAK